MVTRPTRIFTLSLCVTAALLSACASSGTDKQPLAITQPQALGLSQATSTQIPDGWQSLGDPVLDQLIVQALQNQPSLAVAQARVSRMLALAGVAESSSSPQGSLNADLTRQRYSENGLYPKPIAGNIYSSGNVQFGVSWTPDLFGQHTAEIASALNQVQAVQADAAAAALSLAAQVSRGYIALARLGSQREWAQRAVAQRQHLFSLTADRVNAGLDSQLEQRQAEGAMLEAQAQAEAVDEQIELVRHQLAALTGQGPNAYATLMPRVDQLKLEPLPYMLGVDLLGRRADVAAARWRVEGATQDVKVAQTQFYPNVSLGAFAGVNAIGLDQLFDNGSRQVGIMPAVRLPLFDGGRLRAQLKGKQGDLDVAIASYNGLVLDAVKEASDAISASQSLARQHTDQTRSLASAEAAYRIQRDRFEAGMSNQLALLNAESALLAQQRARTDVRARELDNRVALMKSLGGGWRAER